MVVEILSAGSRVLNEVADEKALIIFIHGLTSSKDEPILLHGASFFNAKGYSTFRFNLYGEGPDERKLSEVALADHLHDINQVIASFVQQGKEKIFLVGHSFGGLASLYAELSHVSGVVLRDPSIGGEGLLSDVYQKGDQSYVIDRGDGLEFAISEAMYQDFCIPPEKHEDQIASLSLPIKIIAAEFGLLEQAQRYATAINGEVVVIEGAYHTFEESDIQEQLFQETYSWIEEIVN